MRDSRASATRPAQPSARILRELRGRVHLPVPDGGHLLALHPGRSPRRPRVPLADVHPAHRDALRRPSLRRAGEPLPVAGALYQYSKFNVGPAYGWFVGWFYGIALLVTVASVDTGVVGYVTSLSHNWFGTNWDPTNHETILLITIVLLAIQTTLNITGAKVIGRVAAQFGVGVEIIGTFGIAIILAIHGFHHGLGFLFSTQGATHASTNVYGVGFGGLARSRADRRARAGLHLLRLRVRRRHRRGDEGRRPQDSVGDAMGSDLGRDLILRAHCCAPARHAEARTDQGGLRRRGCSGDPRPALQR